MKVILLIQLVLKNFKGIRSFTLDASGESVKVYGDNATGKTTLFDAFIWLLFDKDSQNKKDFQIKTVSSEGKVLHGLNHEVEGIFSFNGKPLTLRKVYAEKWTKKRGTAHEEFSGHTTDYFIDGVPVKKKEYEDLIKSMLNEDTFKLLTSPSYFNEQLHWDKKRKVLLEVCGDITDEEVIASNRALLQKLPSILNNRSIEDHRKVIAARRGEINKELDKIPVRIDEIYRNLPDVEGLNELDISSRIESLKIIIQDKETEISRINAGSEVIEKQKKLRELEIQLFDLKAKHQQLNQDKVQDKNNQLNSLKRQADDIRFSISRLERELNTNGSIIIENENKMDTLRSEWKVENEKTMEQHHEENCPSCGQVLPEEEIQKALSKAQSDFNLKKAQRLEEINIKGQSLKSENERLTQKNNHLRDEITSLKEQENRYSLMITEVQKELEHLQSSVTNLDDDPTYKALQEQVKNINDEINRLQTSTQEAINNARSYIAIHRKEIDELEVVRAKFSQIKVSEKRIEELKQQEKDLAAEYEKLEEELFLTEEFIRSKVNLLEEKINSKFKYARFKLFEQQINGGLTEVCETLYDGVPYSSGLNRAAQINVGLDIINTLAEHYGFLAPIFVDNREAVTRLIDSKSQLISLIVSENDKKLRIEHNEKLVKEAV